jgi:hypothetical protein
LTSPTTHAALLTVYNDWFMKFDKELTRVASLGLKSSEWSALNKRIYSDSVPRIDSALNELAKELKLTRREPGGPQGVEGLT